MKLQEIYSQILNEEVYGRYVTFYHRTSKEDLVKNIIDHGYKFGSGKMYGYGLYGTYNLESQLRPNMKNNYGTVIIKFQASIDDYFICDYDVFKTSPIGRKLKSTINTYIYDQINYFSGRNFSKMALEYWFGETDFNDITITSAIAKLIATEKVLHVYDKINGIIFTGNLDGKVLVSYYPNDTVIPISYSLDEGETWIKTEQNIKYLTSIFSGRRKNTKTKEVTYGIKELKDGLTLEIIKQKFDGILDPSVTVKDAIIGYDSKEDKLIWYDGKWIQGYLDNVIWVNGEFRGRLMNTTWRGGIFKGGTTFNIDWKDGTWESGTFNGTWESGSWKTGVFEKGIWKDGTWESGDWYGKKWESGIWEGGIWHFGEWVNGTWKGGTWKKGIWKGHKDKTPTSEETKNGSWRSKLSQFIKT